MKGQADGASPYSGNTSRAYRNQAIALIGICRFFAQFAAQGQEQDSELKAVLRTCDDVLRFATRFGQKVSYKTNKRFEYAVQTLSAYASRFHPGIDLVRARMWAAKRKDSADAVLYGVVKPPDQMVVNFVLFKTLPDPKPVVVRQMLSPTAGIEEVLWNFSPFEDDRRIALQDNPRFYLDLPTSSDAYTDQFKARPLENLKLRPNATLYVLIDQPRRVFLEARQETRIFGNIFMLKDVMIFKDVHGMLEGESVVGESIRGIRNLWRSEKFFAISDSNVLAYDFSLWPVITADVTAKRTLRDRLDLVRRALGSGYHELHIYVGQLPPSWTLPEKFLFPFPPAPTSERPGYDVLYTTADTLNSNILRAMFDLCRRDDEEGWNLQLRWCKLSHVCRKWRNVIHQSPSHLNVQIPFTNGAPPLDMLSRLPPIPIVIDFRSRDATEIDAEILHVILQRERIRRIILQAPSATVENLIIPMEEICPTLEYLSPSSTTKLKNTNMMIPGVFLALNLRRLTSHGTLLSKGIPSLASGASLVTFKLSDIQTPGYFPLEDLVTQLQHAPQLEELSVGFSLPTRPHTEKELLRPPVPFSTLPTLRRLEFLGMSAHLKCLLSRISAPLLESFDIALFNGASTPPYLPHFTETTKRLRDPVANMIFNRGSVSLVGGSSGEQASERTSSLHIRCRHFDSPVHSALPIYGAMVPFGEVLTPNFEGQSLPSAWQDEHDGLAWQDLLGPFSSMKRLHIGRPFVSGSSSGMRSDNAELVLGLLPELHELKAKLAIGQADTVFAAFLHVHQLAGRPVRLSVTRVLPVIQTKVFLRKEVWHPAPTSERPACELLYTTADALNSNILLTIFDYCRLDDEEGWNRQPRWCKLSQVCRRWRLVIHQSSFHLNMHVTLTNNTLPLDMLSHLPPLPIVIDYRCGDVAETLHAIQQGDGIRRIVLQAPSPISEKLIVPMDTPFPTLEHLALSSPTRSKEGTQLMIPGTFLTPNLRRLRSRGTSLPKGLPLLASSALLVSLKLTDSQTSNYLTPEDLVTQLQHTPQLEELSIGFSVPMPPPNLEGELQRPSTSSTTLPSLKRLVFRGGDAYFESILSQINAPLLEQFDATLFNQLTFALQHLSHFTSSAEALSHAVASVIFNQEGVSFIVSSCGHGTLNLQVRCKQFDWQTAAATQICSALKPVLSVAEEVTLELDTLPADWRDVVDGKVWSELLGPFNSAKQFRVICPHAPEVSSVLESYRAGVTPGQLQAPPRPNSPIESAHENGSSSSIDAPRPSGRPIYLPPPYAQHSRSTWSFVMIEPDSIPVADPRTAKRIWLRRTVVDRIWKRLVSHVCTRA